MLRTKLYPRLLATTLLPAVLGTLLLFAGTLAFLLWSTRSIDLVSSVRQRELVELGIRNIRDKVAHDQEGSTFWDEAVTNVSTDTTGKWIDDNLGTWMHNYFAFDEIYLLDGDDKPVYAFADGTIQDAKTFLNRLGIVRGALLSLRRHLDAGDTSATEPDLHSIGGSDFALINHRPAVISLKPLLSDSGTISQERGKEYIHIAIRFLDASFLEKVEREYLIDDLQFVWARNHDNPAANVPLTNLDGMTLGYYVWRPFLPGLDFLKSIMPALVVVAALICTLVTLLSLALYRRRVIDKANEARIRYLAHHDSLTGLPNRSAFERDADQLLADIEQDRSGNTTGILYLDLDRFKQVNDTLGHSAGDTVIQTVVQRMAAVLDGVGRIYRVGGDEFTVLLAACRPGDIDRICNSLIGVVAEPVAIGEHKVFIGVSIGVAMAPLHGTERTELVRRADVALYNAKASGRGRASIFGAHMDALIRDRAAIESDLRRDLETGRGISVVYQPKFASTDNKILGVEALARWNNAKRGQISPAVFIPIAEETGLIINLGMRVLETACRDAASWPIDHLAVNVSVIQLREEDFVDRVLHVLDKAGLSPSRLEFELTESAWIDDADACAANLDALRAAGIRIALDDFGTGFSTFARLRETKVDRIKIDQSFIGGFGKSKGDEAIVGAIVELARAKGLKTTAEGIETVEQSERLRLLGCDELQGFLLGRPMSAEDLERLLRNDGGHISAAE